MHKEVAAGVRSAARPPVVLELGAGTLNHLPYEPEGMHYDIVEPFTDLYQNSPLLSRIRNIYRDISGVPPDVSYDRIISIATFEHICDLPEVVARSGLLLRAGGQLRVGIPSEGTPLWRLAWTLTTGLEFKLRYGLEYRIILQHEHVNTAAEVVKVLRYFFAASHARYRGPCASLSLYQVHICEHPIVERCREFLHGRQGQGAGSEMESRSVGLPEDGAINWSRQA
jgi:hypothetical protein